MEDQNSIINQRYAGLRPKRFIDLCDSIQDLYDGPWVVMGNCPEDGFHDKNPKDQEKARKMWRNTYAILKPYEDKIYEDYKEKDLGSYGTFWDEEAQTIRAMYLLCEAYHNNVELWDEVQEGAAGIKVADNKKPAAKPQYAPEKKESPLERMKKAHCYLLETHTYFAQTRLPKLRNDLMTFIGKVPEEKMGEMLKKRKDALKYNLCDSSFFCKCAKWMPAEEEYMISEAFSEEEAGPIYHRSYSAHALEALFDDAGVLDEDKLALYIYDNQEVVSLVDVHKFYAYIDLSKIINDMLPFDENNIMIAELPVQVPEPGPFDKPAPEEPEEVEYNAQKARAYYKKICDEFECDSLPFLKECLTEWCAKFPVGKRKEAIEAKKRSYIEELKRSDFFKYYGAEVHPGFYTNVVDCVDSQWELDRMCADEQFACDIDDLYDGLDVLNEEKLRRYIWVNQKRLSKSQIDSMLTYEAACKLLPALMPTDEDVIAEAMMQMENNEPMMPFDDEPSTDGDIAINTIYTEKLRKTSVYEAYCKAMRVTVIPKVMKEVKGQKRSEKWRWPHVYDALKDKRLEYIGPDAGPTDFGIAMAEINGTINAKNVTQRLKDKSANYPTTADKNIITNIIKTLKP